MRHDGFWGILGKCLLPILLLCVIIACGGYSETTPQEELGAGVGPGIGTPIGEHPMEEMPVEQKPAPIEIPDDHFPEVGGAATPDFNPDDYTAVLDVTEKMELHQKGDLRVWIGLEDYMPEDDISMSRKTTSFPGDEGNYARITPYAPDFTIEPEESQIMRITPRGSSVLFSIIPQKKGEFKVSAKIELFDNPFFDGVPIPKTTNIVSVEVTVDPMVNVVSGLKNMGTVVWDGFMKFWRAIVALLLGALLFTTRKFIKSKTGFMGDGIESSSLSGGSEDVPSDNAETPEEPGSESGEEEDVPDYFDVEDKDKQ